MAEKVAGREGEQGDCSGGREGDGAAAGGPVAGDRAARLRRRGHPRERLEVERQIVRRVEALLRILFEAVPHDALERRRHVLVRDRKIRRILLQDRRHRVGGRVAVEGALAREHLVEDRAEGEDVAARVGGTAAHLFGRHVTERAQDDAGFRAGGGRRQVRDLRAALLRVRELGEAEVEDLQPTVVRDEDVLGLQVPVDDSLLVRRGETVNDLERVVGDLARRQAPAGEDRPQRLALQQLLDDVRLALVRADVVNGRDVRVVEDSRGFGFLLEPAQPLRVRGEGGRQHLDCDVARKPRILRSVHLSHPPRADRRKDLVRTETGTRSQRHKARRFYWGQVCESVTFLGSTSPERGMGDRAPALREG